MVVQVIDLDKLIRKFGDISDINIMPVIAESTRVVQREARDWAPVKTGILRASIKTKLFPRQLSGLVFTTTEYAPYVEFGTRYMKAQPFMQPAINRNRDMINKKMSKYIKSEIKKRV